MAKILISDEAKQAAIELGARAEEELAKRNVLKFGEFIDNTYTGEARHLKFLAKKLKQVERYIETKGKEGIGRLIISWPPRHGKSETATKKWPAYLLGKYPALRIIACAYTQEMANDFSRVVRDTIRTNPYYGTLFPESVISDDSSSVERWALLGAKEPSFIAVGLGGPVVGRGGDLILIDDLLRGRKEAESPAYKLQIQQFYTGALRNRLEPGGAIVIINTRWAEDDLIGWLLSQDEIRVHGDKWEVVNIPAIAEENDPLGREPGEALWPERFDKEALLSIKADIGSYEWESQYQGHPRPPFGSKINVLVLSKQVVKAAPEYLIWSRYWDLALSTKDAASFTASIKGAFDENLNFYLDGGIHEKKEWADVSELMIKTMQNELDVVHGIEEKMQGLGAISQFMRDNRLTKSKFHGVKVDTGKLERALPWIARLEREKLFLVMGEWNDSCIEECRNFTGTGDKYDDWIDAISGAYQMTVKPKWKRIKFVKV